VRKKREKRGQRREEREKRERVEKEKMMDIQNIIPPNLYHYGRLASVQIVNIFFF
jgi:hypothetical protein